MGCRRGSTKGAAYIKISEAEIADDYPEPTQYGKVGLTVRHRGTIVHPLNERSCPGKTSLFCGLCQVVMDSTSDFSTAGDAVYCPHPKESVRRSLCAHHGWDFLSVDRL